jgi:hypothetical protein
MPVSLYTGPQTGYHSHSGNEDSLQCSLPEIGVSI